MPFTRTLAATSTALALAMTAAPMTVMSTQNAAAQEAAGGYSGAQLDAFTVALLQVFDLRKKYTPALQSAESEDQQQEILDKATAEIAGAIEDTDGITLETYQEIAEAATQDQDLEMQIKSRVEDMVQTAE